jgi:hypothetical protein
MGRIQDTLIGDVGACTAGTLEGTICVSFILSIDPGVSNGISLIVYDGDTHPRLIKAWQFSGGADSLRDWLDSAPLPQSSRGASFYGIAGTIRNTGTDIICEAFTARNPRGYHYTTSSLEALVGVGVLIDRRLVDRESKRYRDPNYQYLVGGSDLKDKKRRMHRFLKESGFYVTGKQLGAPDADDARSAIAHGLAYLAREGHKKTFELISNWVERNPV